MFAWGENPNIMPVRKASNCALDKKVVNVNNAKNNVFFILL